MKRQTDIRRGKKPPAGIEPATFRLLSECSTD